MAERSIFIKNDQIIRNLIRAELYGDLTRKTAAREIDFRSAERRIEEYHYTEESLISIPFTHWALRRFWRKPEDAPLLKPALPTGYHSHHY